MTDRKAVVKNADMSDDMQQEAVDVATQVPYSQRTGQLTVTFF